MAKEPSGRVAAADVWAHGVGEGAVHEVKHAADRCSQCAEVRVVKGRLLQLGERALEPGAIIVALPKHVADPVGKFGTTKEIFEGLVR